MTWYDRLKAWMYKQIDQELADTTAGRIHYHMDGEPGQSGSALYFCSGGCSGGATGLVVGIWSGWNPITTQYRGCKTTAKNSWILGEL